MKQGLRVYLWDIRKNYELKLLKKYEVEKFKDPRRVEIANQYPLSKEQQEQIDELYLKNYGEKIDYVWHKSFAAHAGRFDHRFMPESLYIAEFEQFENQNLGAKLAVSDKNMLPLLAKGVGIQMPETIVSCTNGVLRDRDNHPITPQMAEEILCSVEECFVKPSVGSNSGRGCVKVNSGRELRVGRDSLTINSNGGGYKLNFVVQQVLDCHESLKYIYPSAANSFRIITYLWKGHIYHMPIDLKVGRGGQYLDNAHAGGMMVAVDDDGIICNHAVTEFNDQFTEHPDTRVKFEGYRIEHVPELIDAVKRFHANIPQMGCINWDATIGVDGQPIVIEANCNNGSIWHSEMTHGVGPFKERTEEVLQWLRFMKTLKPHERKNFVGGWIE